MSRQKRSRKFVLKPLFQNLNTCLIEQFFSPNLGHIYTRTKTSNESKDQDKVTITLRNTQPQTTFFDSENFNINLRPRETSAIT